MKPWTFCFRLGWLPVVLLFTSAVHAQDPAAIAGVGGIAGAPAPAAAAAAGGPNLFTALLPPPDLMERCRVKLCKCNAIKLLQSMMAPMSLATGGLIAPGCICPVLDKDALNKALTDPTSADGAAALVKKDLAEAAARRASVRFL